MALPWLRLLDMFVDVTNLALSATGRRSRDAALPADSGRPAGQLEAGLAHVVVAAVREAFDRDARRLEFEREQIEQERERAERALKLELLRQAGERDIARLRLVALVALVSLPCTWILLLRGVGGGIGGRVVFAISWLFFLGALAASFAAQTAVSRALARADQPPDRTDELGLGRVAFWMLVLGLLAAGIGGLTI